LVVVSIVSLACIAGYVYLAQYISQLNVEASALKDDVAADQSRFDHLADIEQAAANTVNEQAKVSSLFIQPNKAVDFVTNIETIAGSVGLTYNTDNIDVDQSSDLADQNRELLDINFSTTGSWANTAKFLELVETMPMGLDIRKIDLQSSLDGNGSQSSQTSSGKTVGSAHLWSMKLDFAVVKAKDSSSQ